MNNMLIKLQLKFQDLMNRQEGQDLVEYGLLISLVALAAIVGINKVTSAVNLVFTSISTSL